mmetsp:Transcript_29471/g.38119  ORF Transcript_29471/g.38119 Transcript_29471/m.38119 type:complete len:500 (+) Transcript_29471:55-1554(+)
MERSSGSSSDKDQKKDRKRKERDRAEKERIRKEHARKVLEEQKIQKARRKWQKNTEFLCTLKFRNTLPSPFLGPNFLDIPFPLERLTQYRPNSLDVEYKWKLHCERNLGVPIDIIDPSNYLVPTRPQELAEEDQALLDWKVDTANGSLLPGGISSKEERNAKKHGRSLVNHLKRKNVDTNVTWMKRTMYLANDLYDPVHRFESGQKATQQQLEKLNQDMIAVNAESAATKIAQSFNAANDPKGKKAIKHPTNSSLTPEWVLPVLPDANLWSNVYMHVGFDVDPILQDEPNKDPEYLSAKGRRFTQAVISDVREKEVVGATDPVMVASYLVPEKDAPNTVQESAGEERNFEHLRGYQIEVKDTENTFVFMIDPDNGLASYCKLDTRIDLKKGRPQTQSSTYAKLKRRPFTAEELQQRDKTTREVTAADYSDGEDDDEEMFERADQDDRHSSTHSIEGDRQSVVSEPLESEGSNKAVKGTESSGNDGIGEIDSDDSDLYGS